ncbi:Gfo/Idh/MocA family protein [Cohnella fermenti]|uniref:Gfo/Idh/MocA family oxidoreductase n=1 Tax=Cohnella fermenti TaxID=2565925 RepID=A0A4S4BM06_9BACL|nr:Gfo/Idh/MocA family oxidoreductase [Cohnella fermenti]THF73409.1 Gfo/Idh/MocA family oxidoreductase [Cohnella fermenti]
MNRKFGILGCEHGHIAIFIEEMLAIGHECVGLYEPGNEKLAASIAGKYRIPVLDDSARLLEPDVEIIGSSSINNEKIDVIELCESHGKHIMVDKPAVTNRSGLERLQAVVRRGNVQVGMLLTERFHPAIHTLKKLIERGELGRLVTIGMRKPHRLGAANRPSWFFSREQSGGILVDLLVHDFDLLRWLTGAEIAETNGYMGKHILPEHPEFYDEVSLQVRMTKGVGAQLYADWHTPGRSWTWGDGRIFATGTEGFAELRLSGDPLVGLEPIVVSASFEKETARIAALAPEWSISEDFLRRIDGRPSIIGHSDIVAASLACVMADEQVRIVRAEPGGGNNEQ